MIENPKTETIFVGWVREGEFWRIVSSQPLNILHYKISTPQRTAVSGIGLILSTTDQSIPWNFTNPTVNPCLDNWQGITCSCSIVICSVSMLILEVIT